MTVAVLAAAATIGGEVIATGSFATAFSATVLARAAFSAGIALVGEALARPNAPAQAPAFQSEARGRTHVIRASDEPHRVIYGEVMTSGVLRYATSTGTKKEYLHMVVVLAGHQVQEIGDVYLNDEKLGTLDASGNVTTGRFAGYVRVKKHLGGPDQVADPDLIAEAPNNEWTSEHRGRGRAYLYLRLKWDQSVFPTGIPNPKAIVKGKNDILDVRTSLTGYTNNAALCALDYILWKHGLRCTTAQTDTTTWTAAANVSDEDVFAKPATSITSSAAGNPAPVYAPAHKLRTGDTAVIAGHSASALNGTHVVTVVDADNLTVPVNLAAGGTGGTVQLQQKRYTCNGTFTLDQEPPKVLEDIRSAMGGACIYAMGKWYGYAGAAATPTVTLTEKDLRGNLKYRPRPSKRELFNAVRGTYVNAHDYWQPIDFPEITNSTYEAQDDNQRYYRDIQLPFTTDVYAAQRLGRIELERHRAGRTTVDFPAKITALRLFVWRPVYLDIAELGWNQKLFRVVKWKYAEDGGVDLALESFASTIYDWASGNAKISTAPPDTALPNPFNVAAPTNLQLFSGTAELDRRLDGTIFSRLKATWTAPNDIYVTSGGSIELQFKKSADSAWRQGQPIRGDETSSWVLDVQDGVAYDVQISAVNTLGVRSAWVSVTNHVVLGKTERPTDVPWFLIDGNRLSWGTVSDVDLAGYAIRFHYGINRNFYTANSLHDGLLTESPYDMTALPDGQVTLMIASVDASGNEALNPTVIITDFGDAPQANLVEEFALKALGWPGTVTGGATDGNGDLAATETSLFYKAADAEAFFKLYDSVNFFDDILYAQMVYESAWVQPSKAAVGSAMTLPRALAGEGIAIEYRPVGPSRFYADVDSETHYASADGDAFYDPSPDYTGWPGSLVVSNQPYQFRVTTGNSPTQGKISGLTPTIDVPDIEERLDDVVLAAGGTRLPIAKTYSVIKNVALTLQDDGGTATRVRVLDKNPSLGPLVQADASGTPTTAKVDVIIQGY